jgi:excisionase family DNA binding protein
METGLTFDVRMLLTVKEAAEAAGVCTKTIRRAIRRGDLPAYQTMRCAPIFIRATDLDRFFFRRVSIQG